jgi:ABC-type iron transport system FetAB permease component
MPLICTVLQLLVLGHMLSLIPLCDSMHVPVISPSCMTTITATTTATTAADSDNVHWYILHFTDVDTVCDNAHKAEQCISQL